MLLGNISRNLQKLLKPKIFFRLILHLLFQHTIKISLKSKVPVRCFVLRLECVKGQVHWVTLKCSDMEVSKSQNLFIFLLLICVSMTSAITDIEIGK